MDTKDKYLSQYKAGKKEQYAARCAFFLAGFTITTWAPMIPVIKERLQIGDNILGLLLLCIGVSAFVFMPIAGFKSKIRIVKNVTNKYYLIYFNFNNHFFT